MVILRGENIVALTAEAPPNQGEKKTEAAGGGPGKAVPINRTGQVGGSAMAVENMGMQQAPVGVGIPNQASMQPRA